jgi:antitoxin StbD
MSKFNSKSSVSITELKKDPVGAIKSAKGKALKITNRNVTKAYLVPAKLYREMLNILGSHEMNIEADAAFDVLFKRITKEIKE